MAYDNYYDPSVASVSRPLQGFERHTLSDSRPRQLQTPYLDPHRSPKYEDQDPVYRGKTPQFHGTSPEQLQLAKPTPYEPSPADTSKPDYGSRMGAVADRMSQISRSDLGKMTETGLSAFGEVAPLMQARGKAQMNKAILDKLTGKMQLEMGKKAVEAGLRKFNELGNQLQQSSMAVRQAARNPMMLADKVPSSATTIFDAVQKIEDKDLSNAETMLGWMGDQDLLEENGLLQTASNELSSAQKNIAGPIAQAGISMAQEAGRGQGDVAGAGIRTAAKAGGAKAGAVTGATLGGFTGPAAPVAAPVLSFIGGMLGAAGGSSVGQSLAPAAGQMGAQEISRPAPGLGKMPTASELLDGEEAYG